jgi:hypothetical protein
MSSVCGNASEEYRRQDRCSDKRERRRSLNGECGERNRSELEKADDDNGWKYASRVYMAQPRSDHR